MPIEILWSPTALEYLQAIYEYILADNPAAALDVHEEIERAAGLLQENPRLGHPGRVADTRELVVPAYPTYIIVVRAAREPSSYPGRHAREAGPTISKSVTDHHAETVWTRVWQR